jgi:hypothetical protein
MTDILFRIHLIDVFLSILEIVNKVRLTTADIYGELSIRMTGLRRRSGTGPIRPSPRLRLRSAQVAIRHSPLVIRHLPFATRHSPLATRH